MTKHSGTMRFQQNITRGILFMCLAILLMPVMNTIAKILTVDYPLTQVVWARFTGHFVCMTLLFWPGRGLKLFRSGRPVLQLLRSVIMFLSNGCYIVALSTVALATASAIMFTAPLIVTTLSVPLLGERVGLRRWAAVVVGFIGALIIIRPGLNTPAFDGTALGIVLLLFSAATFALYQILTRKLSDQDSAETNIVYTALIAAIVTTCIMPFVLVMPKGVGDGCCSHWSAWWEDFHNISSPKHWSRHQHRSSHRIFTVSFSLQQWSASLYSATFRIIGPGWGLRS